MCPVNLSGGVGHEQFGSRPAVVLATTDTNIVIVIPVTANTEALRFSHTLLLPVTKQNGLSKESVALLFHVRAVDTRRVEKVCGSLDAIVRRGIDKGLRRLFDV